MTELRVYTIEEIAKLKGVKLSKPFESSDIQYYVINGICYEENTYVNMNGTLINFGVWSEDVYTSSIDGLTYVTL